MLKLLRMLCSEEQRQTEKHALANMQEALETMKVNSLLTILIEKDISKIVILDLFYLIQ